MHRVLISNCSSSDASHSSSRYSALNSVKWVRNRLSGSRKSASENTGHCRSRSKQISWYSLSPSGCRRSCCNKKLSKGSCWFMVSSEQLAQVLSRQVCCDTGLTKPSNKGKIRRFTFGEYGYEQPVRRIQQIAKTLASPGW